MKSKTQTRTEQILTVMTVLAWIAFVGFLIDAGAILVSYGVSIVNPDGARNLHRGLNLYDLKEFSFWHYTCYVSLLAALLIMKSVTALMVINSLSKFKLQSPFTMEVAQRLERINHLLFGTWIVTMVTNGYTDQLHKMTGHLYRNELSGEFIFIVGIVFVISQVFKRGVEIQAENELTV